jgi:predicted ArsR family transcriptional regulator
MDESVLFYFSKGADTRREIIQIVKEKQDDGIYLSEIADKLDMSHVAARKHIELLREEDYLEHINPEGKPKYIRLTENGEKIMKDFEN